MNENTQEKNLIEKKDKSIFSKIKKFFNNIFGKKENNQQIKTEENTTDKKEHNEFKEYIKNIEDEETKLLALQEKYRNGEIEPNDLTEEQIDALCDLYDKQIEELKKAIKITEEKIADRKRKTEKNNT